MTHPTEVTPTKGLFDQPLVVISAAAFFTVVAVGFVGGAYITATWLAHATGIIEEAKANDGDRCS